MREGGMLLRRALYCYADSPVMTVYLCPRLFYVKQKPPPSMLAPKQNPTLFYSRLACSTIVAEVDGRWMTKTVLPHYAMTVPLFTASPYLSSPKLLPNLSRH